MSDAKLDRHLHARAVADAVFSALLMAQDNPSESGRWFAHADKLEAKFTHQYGRHYSYFTKAP